MPELPEVETVCRGLNRLTLGQTIQGGQVLHPPTLAFPEDFPSFWSLLTGACFHTWQRRGKYLLAHLTKNEQFVGYLGVHLRMTGQLIWRERGGDNFSQEPEEVRPKHTRIYWQMSGNQELQFIDSRTFGRIWGIPAILSPEQVMTGLQKLGPEPFAPEFSPDYLAQKFHRSQRQIKPFLLDQSLVAGLGNIYADEVLFQSGIRPTTLASQLSLTQIQGLHQAIQEVLTQAIAAGGTTFRDFREVTGINGNYGGIAWVYGRQGEACRRCGTPIERFKLAGRSSHFCPACQS